ncbi:MAG TPA: cytochrome C oxidase subunit IV family protein [Blastocatellia bacterium]|jgi:caa(3)-type oxidase, subunit IV|nr:cytochrome C oxidase subunit IV family protein [Blastocatellia bacterium]
MVESKLKEIKLWNMVLLGLSALSIGAAILTVASDRFKAGTDDVFLVLVCLMLALLFAVPPLMWAHANGMLKNPFADEADEGTAAIEAEAAHGVHGGSNRENVIVWGGLLALTAIEVFLAYIQIDPTLMLIILMGASIIKAALIVAYFMHLKFERLSLILTIVPTLVVLLCLFSILFPDGFRLRTMRPAEPAQQQVEHEQ